MSKKIAKIVEVIATMDVNDKSLWTTDGKPQVFALSKLMAVDVTAAERDHAWDIYQKAAQKNSEGADANAPTDDPGAADKNVTTENGASAGEGSDHDNHDDGEAGTKAEGTDTKDNDAPTGAGPIAGGKYEVLSPLQHNGTRYEPGEPVELSAEDAAPLLPATVKPWKK